MSEMMTREDQLLFRHVWNIMALGGSRYMADKPQLTPQTREVLVQRGFATVTHDKRRIRVELTDAAWAWARKEAEGDIARFDGEAAIVARMAAWHGATLRRIDSDFAYEPSPFVEKPEVPPTGPSNPEPPLPETGPERDEAVFAAVSAAYAAAGGTAVQRLMLSKVRPHLQHISRQELDESLLRLKEAERLAIIRTDHPHELTAADHEAALDLRGMPLHILWIRQ